MNWKADTFLIAMAGGPISVAGYTYRGLGLHLITPASPKGRRKAKWSLTHLGSGHRVAILDGAVAEAFPIASDIAEAGDWEFDSLQGYKDRFPDAATKVDEILRHSRRGVRSGGGGSDENIAREIALSRW